MGIAFVHLSKDARSIDINSDLLSYEAAIELTYKAQFFEWLCIQPDLQYIINPGAIKNINNSTVGLIRTYISF